MSRLKTSLKLKYYLNQSIIYPSSSTFLFIYIFDLLSTNMYLSDAA
jgi:hypothetical protein